MRMQNWLCNETIDAANIQSQGAQGAIFSNEAQAMGQGGGDFALTQRALAAQGASNNAATQGMQAAAEAEANREAALNQMANIGGSVNASDYGQAANKAQAQNTINATKSKRLQMRQIPAMLPTNYTLESSM